MIRSFLNSALQKKYFVMFFTSVIYIAGLFVYFNEVGAQFPILAAFVLLVLGIFAILKNYLSPKLVMFWYFMFFFAFFNASLRIKDSDALYQLAPQNATIQGQIVSIPQGGAGGKAKFFVDVSKINYGDKTENIKAKTLVTVYDKDNDFSKFNIGNFYQMEGKLRAPFEVSNPSQFDYGKYLKNFGVFSIFYANENGCKKFDSVGDKKLTPRWRFLQGLNNVRNQIIAVHSKYLKSPNLEILGGMVFGDDAVSAPDDIKKSFANSGLLHILAASGMNVALIYGIWFFILRRLRVPFNITVSSGIFVVVFYAMMTGLGPSVIRATFMLIFILIGKLIDRDAHSISLLSFVALLMLIYNPAYINDVGFQLSFLVTFGLLTTAPVVFEKVKNMPNWLSGAIFIPVVAQVWVAPIQMYYFNSFSLYSIFANIASLPFLTVISFGGFVSSVLALIKPIANQVCFLFDFVLNPFLSGLVFISDYFSNLPHSLIKTPQPNILQIFLYYGLVLFITFVFKYGKDKKLILASAFLFMALFFSCLPVHNKKLETIAFDVQNADLFLIKTPQDKYFLIDSGKMSYKGGKTQAKMIVMQYLKDHGIKNIEGFVITHFDSDHAGGAVDLIENLNIKNVYLPSIDDKSKLAQKIYEAVKHKKNISISIVQNNKTIYREGNLTVKNFIANTKVQDSEELENENSIVTLVSDKNFDQLFMADAGVLAFENIKKNLPNKIEIFKVGHHGAKNVVNKALLDRINPDVAIISTGLNNYGHPNGVTLDVLDRHKVRVFRTDRQNAIKIEERIDNSYNVYSYAKNGWVKRL